MVYDLTHARHDPAHVLAPGLFRSLGPGDRAAMKLDVTYLHGQDQMEFKGHEPLGVDDMRVLQGIVAMAGPDGLILRDEDDLPEAGRQLLLDLFSPPAVVAEAGRKPDTLVVRDSFRRLAREIGLPEGGANLRLIRKSVERLFGVTVFVQSGKRRVGMRLLSAYASDEGSGDLYVALNPRLAGAIFGDRQHIRIDLAEVRALGTDPARLIHQRLCGWIDAGKSGKVSIETLAEYVWPVSTEVESTQKKRRATTRKALAELSAIGWTVDEYARGKMQISRPKKAKGC